MTVRNNGHRGIALMVTLFFIIAITAAVAVSLSQLKTGTQEVEKTRFIVQSTAMVEDVLGMLASIDKVYKIENAEGLQMLLESASFIPFNVKDLEVMIKMKSAMGKMNVNSLAASQFRQEALINYLLQRYNVQDPVFFNDLLLDSIGGDKPEYKTELFYDKPQLYRERIAGPEHFERLLDYYVTVRHDNSIKQVPWDNLIRFDDANSTQIDANYVSSDLWQLMLPSLYEEAALMLSEHVDVYTELGDLQLSQEEAARIQQFGLVYYAPQLDIYVNILDGNQSAEIRFQYDLSKKEAKEFEYVI